MSNMNEDIKFSLSGRFPEKITIGRDICNFDCIAGTGEPVYKRKMKDGTIKFYIVINEA